jgi:uncharacterized membrane protein YheB (UPF0754 family)|tara:strand:- start:54 stop:332 length:279 start_codon:yes stop_codon:yes gene_type:complete
MKLTQETLKEMIVEELSKSDKNQIKKMISTELDSFERQFKKSLKPIVEEELKKLLKNKDVKSDVADISKKILKKLYKDLAFQHPYIIDRIKL